MGAEPEQTHMRGPEVKLETSHLEDYFDWEHVYPFSETPSSQLSDEIYTARLNYFTTTTQSQILYASGHHQAEGLNLLRQSAATYISLAREARVPVVSYFCSLSHSEAPRNRTRESVELSALLYSLIRQLIELLPAELTSPVAAINGARIATLDGTLRTWDQATRFFVDLVDCVRLPLILFVIGSINVLEDDLQGGTTGKLENLVGCLKHLSSSMDDDRMVKILFTTAGVSRSLCG